MDTITLDSFFTELGSITKEAGWGRDFLAWAKQRHRQAKKVKGKVDDVVLSGSIKAYQAMPAPVQKAVSSPTLMDQSDPTVGTAARNLAHGVRHILKVGSKQDEHH